MFNPKISVVSYLNSKPFIYGLENAKNADQFNYCLDIPAICAQKLKFGQVDIALVPVALLPELSSYFIETDFCISADGKVESVKLYSEVPLNQIKTITLDYQSKSSVTLIKVLAKFFWKLDVGFRDGSPGFENEIKNSNAAVIIGDRTFLLNKKYSFEFDLADEWKKFTNLPFVFAAWVSIEKLPVSFINEFNSALKYGVNNIQQAVNDDFKSTSLSKKEAFNYLTKRINYNLTADKRKGLQLFLEFIL